MKTVKILNGHFHSLTLNETIDRVMTFIHSGKHGYLCTVNVAILMMMRLNSRLQQFVDEADFVVADGQPLIWSGPFLNARLPERVTGIDLVDAICERAVEENLGIYWLGARSEVVNEVVHSMQTKYPGLNLSGFDNGYFTEEETPERIQIINKSGAKILIVAMGVPRQEYFLQDHWDELDVNFAIGVGGSFDVIAGIRARAPKLLQKLGMEWFFRLIQEPRRLWKRYLLTNSQFIYYLLKEIATSKRNKT